MSEIRPTLTDIKWVTDDRLPVGAWRYFASGVQLPDSPPRSPAVEMILDIIARQDARFDEEIHRQHLGLTAFLSDKPISR